MSEARRPPDHPRDVAERQKALLIRIIRAIFIGSIAVVTALAILGGGSQSNIALNPAWQLILGLAIILTVVVYLIDYFTPTKKIATLASVFFGLLLALLATVVLGYVMDQLAMRWEIDKNLMGTVKVLVGIGLAYLGIVTVLQTQDDFRLVIPYVEFAKQIRGARPMLLDSSALIDARIVEVGETGLVQAPLIVPRFVVAELQMLADSSDRMKRARGRRGLEVVSKLQRSAKLDVSIDETPVPGKAVDQMLIELARAMPAVIVTTDLGLTRVARIQGVEVLNLHDLANAMKPSVIPGEEVTLALIKPGEQPTQGVGYLEDGTMVVAENGAPYVGKNVTIAVTSSLQTSAGRLIFGRVREDGQPPSEGATDAPPRTEAAPVQPPAPEAPARSAPARPLRGGRNPRR